MCRSESDCTTLLQKPDGRYHPDMNDGNGLLERLVLDGHVRRVRAVGT